MSQQVDRYQMLRNIRVWSSLKNDASWIQESEQDDERDVSYSLSTAKKSLDFPLSPNLQIAQCILSDGNSVNWANGAVIPPENDAQPEGSTVGTKDNTKPQAPTEHIQNGEAQPEKSVNSTSAANKDGYADILADQSNTEDSKKVNGISADVHVKECIRNGEVQSYSEKPEAMSPVEPEEKPVVNPTAPTKGEYVAAALDQSAVEHSEVSISAGVHSEARTAETHAAADAEESKPAKKACDEQASITVVEASEVLVEPLPEKSSVVNTTPGEKAALQGSVEAAPDLLQKPVSELSAPAAETATEGCEKAHPEKAAEELTELSVATADLLETSGSELTTETTEESWEKILPELAAVDSSPEAPAESEASAEVPGATNDKEAVLNVLEKSVSESSTAPAAETETKEICEEENAPGEPNKVVVETTVESSSQTPGVSVASGEQAGLLDDVEGVPDLVIDSVPGGESAVSTEAVLQTKPNDAEGESTVQPAEKTCDKQASIKVVEASEVLVEHLPEKNGIVNTTPGENAALRGHVEAAPDLEKPVSESFVASAPAAETATEGCEKVQSEKVAGEPIETIATATMKSSSETTEATDASREVSALHDSVTAVPDLLEKSGSELTTETEESCEKILPELAAVDSSPEAPAESEASAEVPGAKNDKEAVLNVLEKSVSESSTAPAAGTETKGRCEEENAPGEPNKAVVETTVESSPQTPGVSVASGEQAGLLDDVERVPDLVTNSVSGGETAVSAEAVLQTRPDETTSPVEPEEKPVVNPTAPTKGEYVAAALDQSAVEHSEVSISAGVHSEDPAAETYAAATVSVASGEQTGLQDSVGRVPDLVTDSVSGDESAASAEAALKTTPNDGTVVELIVGHKRGEDHVVEPTIEDAAESAKASDAEAVQDRFDNSIIKLTDALDLEPPTTEATPEPLKDPEQSHTQETQVSQQSDNNNNFEILQKPGDEQPPTQTQHETRNINDLCSFCDKIIDGNERIIFNEPPYTCHPECLRCDMCAKALGDLHTPMFLHKQVIICDTCFATTL